MQFRIIPIEAPLPGGKHKSYGWLATLNPAAQYEQRGNIDYDQVRLTVRHGPAGSFQMFGGGVSPLGDVLVFDGVGNAIDGGGPPLVKQPSPPAHSSSPGSPGMFAIDGSGNIYFCYGTNAWVKFTGGSTSF